MNYNEINSPINGPVWIDPPRFWAAIAGKTDEEITGLLESIARWHAEGNEEALLRYDFVTGVGYPYPVGGRAKKPAA